MYKLTRDFYATDTKKVAKALLGKYLVHRVTPKVEKIGKIVEVEAYVGPHDLAAHSSKGITKRTRVMFGPPGYAYVYMIYGVHFCMNAITENEGHGAGVLIRALEPIQHVTERTNGPGLLCKAMEIDKKLYGHDLLSDNFFIAENRELEQFAIVAKPRIGVDYAGQWAKKPLRYYLKGNNYVSRK